MKNIYLANAFSLQMVSEFPAVPIIEEVDEKEVAKADFISAIGHPDTATVLSQTLGRTVDTNRVSIHLEAGEVLYVAQLCGGRLPEGATTLPEGFEFKFIKVRVLYKDSLCLDKEGGVCECITQCPCNCTRIS